MDESQDSDIYGSQMQKQSHKKRFSGYKETSFDSLHTVDHLFVTDSIDIDSENFAVLLKSESAHKNDKKLVTSSKKINKLK